MTHDEEMKIHALRIREWAASRLKDDPKDGHMASIFLAANEELAEIELARIQRG